MEYKLFDEYITLQALLKELEEDIMPIDDLIGFAMSDAGKACFGEKWLKIFQLMLKKSRPKVHFIVIVQLAKLLKLS